FGVVWLVVASKMPGRDPVRIYPEDAVAHMSNGEDRQRIAKSAEERASERNKRRNFRKKLR
ncbi:MAG: hypothetical protein FWD88_00745, partial [Treponema sp.]|nr:hypothetical protein [Treponema sp.]